MCSSRSSSKTKTSSPAWNNLGANTVRPRERQSAGRISLGVAQLRHYLLLGLFIQLRHSILLTFHPTSDPETPAPMGSCQEHLLALVFRRPRPEASMGSPCRVRVVARRRTGRGEKSLGKCDARVPRFGLASLFSEPDRRICVATRQREVGGEGSPQETFSSKAPQGKAREVMS